MNKHNVLKVIAIVVIILSFAVGAGWAFLAVYNHNVNMVFESITSFIMGICLAIILYFEW